MASNRTDVRFPKLAAKVRRAIDKDGRTLSALCRACWPDRANPVSMLGPTLRGTGRLHPENRPALERELRLPASIWSMDGIPEPERMHAHGRLKHTPAGPVARALALRAVEPVTVPVKVGDTHEVGIMFRDGRAHVRINVVLPAVQGMKLITMLDSLGVIVPSPDA